MSEGFEVDPAVLAGLADRLRAAAQTLDAAGRGAPGVPDAGVVSGGMAAAIAHLTESAGGLVVGVGAAGEELAAGGATYARADEDARRDFDGLGD